MTNVLHKSIFCTSNVQSRNLCISILQYLLGSQNNSWWSRALKLVLPTPPPPFFFHGKCQVCPLGKTAPFLRIGHHSLYLKFFGKISLKRSILDPESGLLQIVICRCKSVTACYCLLSNVMFHHVKYGFVFPNNFTCPHWVLFG